MCISFTFICLLPLLLSQLAAPEGFQVIEGFTAHKSSRHCELQWGIRRIRINEWFIDWASGVITD